MNGNWAAPRNPDSGGRRSCTGWSTPAGPRGRARPRSSAATPLRAACGLPRLCTCAHSRGSPPHRGAVPAALACRGRDPFDFQPAAQPGDRVGAVDVAGEDPAHHRYLVLHDLVAGIRLVGLLDVAVAVGCTAEHVDAAGPGTVKGMLRALRRPRCCAVVPPPPGRFMLRRELTCVCACASS